MQVVRAAARVEYASCPARIIHASVFLLQAEAAASKLAVETAAQQYRIDFLVRSMKQLRSGKA